MKTSKRLLVLGAGQYGKVVAETSSYRFEDIIFLDDQNSAASGPLSSFIKYPDRCVIVAIGNGSVRMKWLSELEECGQTIATVLSDQAYISPSATVGAGCVVEPGCVIQSGAVIGKGTFVSSGAVINHNAVIGEGCHIDCNSTIGARAVIPNGTHIGYGEVVL